MFTSFLGFLNSILKFAVFRITKYFGQFASRPILVPVFILSAYRLKRGYIWYSSSCVVTTHCLRTSPNVLFSALSLGLDSPQYPFRCKRYLPNAHSQCIGNGVCYGRFPTIHRYLGDSFGTKGPKGGTGLYDIGLHLKHIRRTENAIIAKV